MNTSSVSSLNLDIFWKLYDEFVLSDFRQESLNTRLSAIAKLHIKEMFELKRPEKGWATIRAWICLRNEMLYNAQGNPAVQMGCGDVVIRQYHWDRDVLITHSPKEEMVCGPLLGREQSHGLFLPLFDPVTIERAIVLRLEEERKRILQDFHEEKKMWRE
jgi:hypothetical protein